jgi:hypothetical protein
MVYFADRWRLIRIMKLLYDAKEGVMHVCLVRRERVCHVCSLTRECVSHVFAAKGMYIAIYKKQNEKCQILVPPVMTRHRQQAHIHTPSAIGSRNVMKGAHIQCNMQVTDSEHMQDKNEGVDCVQLLLEIWLCGSLCREGKQMVGRGKMATLEGRVNSSAVWQRNVRGR